MHVLTVVPQFRHPSGHVLDVHSPIAGHHDSDHHAGDDPKGHPDEGYALVNLLTISTRFVT